VCLGLFFGAHYIVDLAQWTDLLIFLIGIALLVAELFVPGGILGILGAGMVIIGLFMSLLGKIQYVTAPDLTDAFTSVGIAFILTVIGGAVLLRGFAEMPVFKRLMLNTRQQPGRGDGVPATTRNELIGREGITETNLRPAGRVRVGERYYEATSEGDHIEAGTLVRVVGVDSLSGIVVRQI
jgi:membrane-bound serine protease (ClpP class)